MVITQQLNSKNRRRLLVWRLLIVGVFLLLITFVTLRIIFPTTVASYLFQSNRSPKNTITALTLDNHTLEFYTSTSQNFSTIELELELKDSSQSLANYTATIQKSYRAFFSPIISSANVSIPNIKENLIIKSGISALVINEQEKFPFNNPRTFLNMGYKWENLEENFVNTSNLREGKLLNISSIHPNGTIFKTKESSKYYYYTNYTKLLLPQTSKIKNFKNNILVSEKSMNLSSICILQKKMFSAKKYSCTFPIEDINKLIGKDYRFKIKNLPTNIQLQAMNLKLKKSINQKNLLRFLTTTKGRIFLRFKIPIPSDKQL